MTTRKATPFSKRPAAASRSRQVFNFLFLGGSAKTLKTLDRALMQPPRLLWRPAEDVEREVVKGAVAASGERPDELTLEQLLSACEVVESRHLIEDGAVARHFRTMWNASRAYCKAYLMMLVADAPGGTAENPPRLSVRDGATDAPTTGHFSLSNMVQPPYRILQGSYRYAGRAWCVRNWGTPEEARLVAHAFAAFGANVGTAGYEFETVEAPPLTALASLLAQHPELALGGVCVDGTTGKRTAFLGGLGKPWEMRAIDPTPLGGGPFTWHAYSSSKGTARQLMTDVLQAQATRRS